MVFGSGPTVRIGNNDVPKRALAVVLAMPAVLVVIATGFLAIKHWFGLAAILGFNPGLAVLGTLTVLYGVLIGAGVFLERGLRTWCIWTSVAVGVSGWLFAGSARLWLLSWLVLIGGGTVAFASRQNCPVMARLKEWLIKVELIKAPAPAQPEADDNKVDVDTV